MDEFLDEIKIIDTWTTLGWEKNGRTTTLLPNPSKDASNLKWQSPIPLFKEPDSDFSNEHFKSQLQDSDLSSVKDTLATLTTTLSQE